MAMDMLLERLRRLINLFFGKDAFVKIDLSDINHSCVEDVDKILQTYKNIQQVAEFILEGKPSIQSIPTRLYLFSNVQRVILCGNQLQDIPWSIVYLRRLKEFDVSFNALTFLPRIVGHIPTLEVLSIRNNLITYLPTDLINLPKLKTLNVQGNPLVSPPHEIAEKGLQSILHYLKIRKGRRNLFAKFTPWISDNDITKVMEVPSLLELSVKCVLDCRIDFVGARDIPPRLKSSLEDMKKQEQKSLFICKCEVCNKYFSNKFNFEIHDCGNKVVSNQSAPTSVLARR
ncbi:leucine-rich repeat and calponin homology domain-containing protein 1-like isoform X1 [Montipora capricornis]|uniref:leucine-rich repeat and calponin homology domain-containing protein 1-like isoform X1 n=1 Tax=Montipora capricornis TaxID=246305 RepID=UPI0035F12801